MRKRLALPIKLIAIGFALNQLYQATFGLYEAYLTRSLHLAVGLLLLFLVHPLSKKDPEGKLSFGIDILLVAVTAGIGAYMVINHNVLLTHSGKISTLELILGGALILIVLEATRRVVGIPLIILVVVLLLYTIFGRVMPGPFLHSGSSIVEFIDRNFLDFYGVLGLPTAVMVSYIFVYVIFGSFLMQTGVANYFKELSYFLMGKQIGGIGKVAVVSSALVGSISGSAVANVMTTGSYTIPAMKRDGYPPVFAGSIEAAASTGGQIMPPVMASAAFLLAAFVGISYVEVMIAAFIPAALYFVATGLSIHCRCLRYGLGGAPQDDIPRKMNILRKSFLLIPLVVLVIILLQGYTAGRAALWAIVATIAFSFILTETRLTPRRFLTALEDAGKSVLQLTATVAVAGIITLLILLSGLGYKMPTILSVIAGDNLFLATVIMAVAIIIVTSGMTTTAGYVIGAVLFAPILIYEYGMPELASHLFILYFAVVSGMTPPIALSAFAAATIAGTGIWRTCIVGLSLSASGFIIPFLFLMEPGLLLEGPIPQILLALIKGLVFISALSFGIHGYGALGHNILFRAVFLIVAILLVIPYYLPTWAWSTYLAYFAFGVLVVGQFAVSKIRKREVV